MEDVKVSLYFCRVDKHKWLLEMSCRISKIEILPKKMKKKV